MWYWPAPLVGRIAAVTLAVIAAILILLVVLLWTGPGNALVASLVGTLTGGEVTIHGLGGNLPNHIKADSVELRDSKGVWLKAEGVTLDWHALDLFSNHVDVQSGHIARVDVLRPHIAQPSTEPSTTVIDVAHLQIDRIVAAKAVFGRPATLDASGTVHYRSRHDFSVDLLINRLDGPGRYRADIAIRNDVLTGSASLGESGDGLIGGGLGLPDLGPVNLALVGAEGAGGNRIDLRLTAGDLSASAGGTIDLTRKLVQLDFSAEAPAMHPRPDMSWSSIAADGHIHGVFGAPDVASTLHIIGLSASGYAVGDLAGELQAHKGILTLRATATGTRITGSSPALFAGSPVVVTGRADLASPTRPVTFDLEHPLLHITGLGTMAGRVQGTATLTVPALGPLAAVGGVTLDGPANFTVKAASANSETTFELRGDVDAKGVGQLVALLGKAKLTASGFLGANGNIGINATLAGAAIDARVAGGTTNGTNDYQSNVTIKDLARAVASLNGSLVLEAKLSGKTDDMRLTLNGGGDVASKGFPRERVMLVADASGLPRLKSADVRLTGRFDRAPVTVAATLAPNGPNGWKASIEKAEWRSARAQGQFAVAGKGTSVTGSALLRVAKLADLAPFTGQTMQGSIDARVAVAQSGQNPVATLHATAQSVQSGTTHFDRLAIDGTVADPLRKPVIAMTVSLPNFTATGVTGNGRIQINGGLDALVIVLTSSSVMSGNQPVTIDTKALVNIPKEHLAISHFTGIWKSQTVTLASPATFDLHGSSLAINADFVAGKAGHFTVHGIVPTATGQHWNLHVTANGDAGEITSALASVGQTLRGKLAADVTVTGTQDKPMMTGNASLTGGEYSDAAYGLNLRAIEAKASAHGTLVRLTDFTAHAGDGTLTGSGTIDLSAPGMPVDMTFKASKARPIVSDLITATLDADMKLQGKLADHVALTGTLRATSGNINIPQSFPPNVAVLNVRRGKAGPPPSPPPPPPPLTIGLDLTMTSPGRLFVRGRGIEAEFGGDLKITGTSQNPLVLGALTMRQGTLSLGGATLTFQSGKIGFEGQGLRERLDPTLNFTAQSVANGITATLTITGTASQPKLELSSTPALPQDEILAQLLFQQSTKQLSPLQLAQIGQAVASFSGLGGGGFDPVGAMRRSLGLDKLSIGSTQATAGTTGTTTVEAGKYVLHNVYVGARQDLSGGTHALVQVDITKNLKAQATIATGTKTTATSTPLQDNGDSLGITYQFEY